MVEFNKEAISEIIDLGRLEPFFLVLGTAYDFGIETDGDGAVYEDEDLDDALRTIGASIGDYQTNSAVLEFGGRRWRIDMENRENRHNPEYNVETVFYFGPFHIKEIITEENVL